MWCPRHEAATAPQSRTEQGVQDVIEPELPSNESARLEALDRYDVLDTPPEGPFDEMTWLAAQMLGVPIALVSLVDARRQWFKSRFGLAATETSRKVSFCGHAVAQGRLLLVPDALADVRFHDNPLVTGEPGVRFYAGAPLCTAEGHVLGTLCAIDRRARQPSEREIEALQVLARQVVGQLELRRQVTEARRLSAIIETTPDFVLVMDVDGRPVYANRAARATLGLAPGERLPPSLDACYPEGVARQLRAQALPAALREGSWLGESVIRDADGTEIPVLQLLLVHPGASGQARHLTIHARNLSELKALERLKSEFVAVVSHELRTPLTSIRGSLRLLEGGAMGRLPDAAGELVRIASSSTERLMRLVNDILDLEKIDSGRFRLDLRRLDVAALVEQAVAGVQGMARELGVAVSVTASDAGEIPGDEDRLLQVLINLLSNALKFSPAGARVEISAAHSERQGVRIAVKDEGPGIDPEDARRIFGRFQQLDSSDARRYKGTGLGLAIAKAIVEEHGGRIGLDSALGRGATFWFDLPGAPAPGADAFRSGSSALRHV